MDYDELMRLALAEAELAIPHGDVPVGALVVVDGEVIASRHNERELTGDPTAHAEVLPCVMPAKGWERGVSTTQHSSARSNLAPCVRARR